MKSSPAQDDKIPVRYQKDFLHLMALGAHSLYAYWEISDRRRWLVSQHFQCDYRDMPSILRLYDVTDVIFGGDNAHASWDMQAQPDTNNWYFHQLSANRSYIVDVGTYTWEREFIPLLRSNCAVTPRDTEAAWEGPKTPAQPDTGASPSVPLVYENIQAYSPYAR
ncbi:DUF4912 domain-containing protein [Bacillus sp. 3255]|uniref:DUF4912 domain-containing protein n=1 Tax=Bacillus sp. 3255 TaxID=2817904 RepID=UPI00285E6A0A|nr:DUF4912 domain-containing protein [Bacillus sp. 3255]MDR6878548.1 hypothetical protein [Bacillus sp. 3255]